MLSSALLPELAEAHHGSRVEQGAFLYSVWEGSPLLPIRSPAGDGGSRRHARSLRRRPQAARTRAGNLACMKAWSASHLAAAAGTTLPGSHTSPVRPPVTRGPGRRHFLPPCIVRCGRVGSSSGVADGVHGASGDPLSTILRQPVDTDRLER